MAKEKPNDKQLDIWDYDTFAESLEVNIAIMITPYYGREFDSGEVRKLANRLAMFVSRRCREAGKLPDFQGTAKFCPNCLCWACQLERANKERVVDKVTSQE